MHHINTALRVKLAQELRNELNRWTDLPGQQSALADAACWKFLEHSSNTVSALIHELETSADYHWEECSAELKPDAPKDEHRRQNRRDWRAGAQRIVKRHEEAVKAARSAGIL